VVENEGLPKKVLFSCTEEEFAIVDAEEAKRTMGYGRTEPWMSFKTAPGNVIETPPKQVVSNQNGVVGVECEDGTVYVDFAEGTARKETSVKEFRYMGGIDQRNDGLGYIAVS